MINNDNDARTIQSIINRNCLHPDYAAALKNRPYEFQKQRW